MNQRMMAWRGSVAMMLIVLTAWCLGQAVDPANRPVKEVRIEGLGEADKQLVLNQINLKAGDPYDAQIVARDIQNITRLGRFRRVSTSIEPNADGTVTVIYTVQELRVFSDVQVVGNKNKSDQELLGPTMLRAGDPRDPFLIDRARDIIKKVYADSGYFLADVTVDEETLNENGILILRVREGPRVKVRGVDFEGNNTYPDDLLRSKVKTNTYIWIFRKGILSREQLDQDVARVRDYYTQRGYLDVRVGRQILLSDDQKNATVQFVIDEGRQYTVNSIVIVGNETFHEAEVFQAMTLKIGEVYSQDRQRTTQEVLEDLYGKLGRLDTAVRIERVFHPTDPKVDLTVNVQESEPYQVGGLIIRGNAQTQDKVFRRQVRGLEPGRRYDSTGLTLTERRIRETGLLDLQQPDPVRLTVLGDEETPVRDTLIEVKEGNTGSLSFGAAVSSDAGLFGAIDLTQRNFDIADVPESWGEFFSGQAFRGAGQYFNLTIQPGNEFQRYQVNFREPYLADSDVFLDTNAFLFTRAREDWDEERLGATVGLGKRFGDVWSASVRTRVEQVTIDGIDRTAPLDAFAVEGDNIVDSLGLFVTRETVDSRFFPTEGTRLTGGIERVGVLGGDFDFTRATVEFDAFFTVDEDFFGRKTVLKFSSQLGYIFEQNESPLFERYYAGGHRSFRGFEFRGVGPRGDFRANGPDGIPGTADDIIREGDDPVGGDWMFLLSTEYNFPIYQEMLRGVVFIDSGTVQEDIGFDEYRVSVGGGIRLQLPFLGQAPFAFDLAYPLVKEEGDETRIFSFDIALPF